MSVGEDEGEINRDVVNLVKLFGEFDFDQRHLYILSILLALIHNYYHTRFSNERIGDGAPSFIKENSVELAAASNDPNLADFK